MDIYYQNTIKHGYTYITAHTGCEGTPWNSMEHVLKGIQIGAEVIEIDIQRDGDYLYLSHDAKEDNSGCPALADCFKLLKDTKALINCDVKRPGLMEPVCKLAKKYGIENRIHFTGQADDSDRRFLKESGCPAGWWLSVFPSAASDDRVREAMDFLDAYDRDRIICVRFDMLNRGLLEEAEKRGFYYAVWTPDNDDDIISLLKLKLVNITTTRPVRAAELRKTELGY